MIQLSAFQWEGRKLSSCSGSNEACWQKVMKLPSGKLPGEIFLVELEEVFWWDGKKLPSGKEISFPVGRL